MKKVRVLIVEDSAVVRELLRHIIGQDARLEVAAAAASAEEALAMLDRMSPDVISLDVRLPGINGLEATRRIMASRPTPIVIVSASVESADMKIAIKALEAGALAILEKPVGTTHNDYETLARRLCTQLAIMSEVKVVRQRPRPCRTFTAPGEYAPQGSFEMLGIVSSTGGPAALVQLLGALGPSFPLPILLVQHMTGAFLEGFAAWLGDTCRFPVVIVGEGRTPAPGVVHLAPMDRHLSLDPLGLRLHSGCPVCGQRPSGTVLFQGMARTLGPRGLGVVLTGMGEDGAAGLLELRKAGGYTIAEDPSTAVVYGMPGAAVRLNAACESRPLEAIGPRVLELAAPRLVSA